MITGMQLEHYHRDFQTFEDMLDSPHAAIDAFKTLLAEVDRLQRDHDELHERYIEEHNALVALVEWRDAPKVPTHYSPKTVEPLWAAARALT
jgi:hypothetical protein